MTSLVNPKDSISNTVQLTTFYVEKELYGIEVMRVQEVTGNPTIVKVPLAPAFVLGMINLRGQISTALGLRTLFGYGPETSTEKMSVVCRIDGGLVSLLVDSIGEVVEVSSRQFESPPETIPSFAKKLLKGIYKMDGVLLSVIDLEKLSQELCRTNESEGTGDVVLKPESRRSA